MRSSGSIFLSLVVAWSALCGANAYSQSTQPKDYHLFLLVGQSNMAGRGLVAESDTQPDPRVLMLDRAGNWQPAVDPMHFDKPKVVGVGPGRSFGLAYAAAHPNVTVGLIPCAVGGSPIDSWQPGAYYQPTDSHPYDDALARARVALSAGTLKGILWHQGESDSKAGLSESYEEKLVALIKRFRHELQAPDVPFLMGQMGQFSERPWDQHKLRVDQTQRQLARLVSNVAFASSSGLKHKGDEVHFDAAGARELGGRYFQAWQELQKKQPAPNRTSGTAAPGNSEDAARLVKVARIWDHSKHNAFTDLVRFNDKWFCVFREGTSHVSPDGALRVITSTDGQEWTSAARLTSATADLRDAKLTVTPDQRLMLSGAGAQHDTSQYKYQSLSWFSSDGATWSEPHPIGQRDNWLWRTTWHDSLAYGVGYTTNNASQRLVKLFRSEDGIQYDVLVERLFTEGYPNESSLVFDETGKCYCLLRRDGGSKTGQLGTALPPYTQWQWQDLGIRIGGPHLLQIPDGRFVAAVRLYDQRVRTALCWLDPLTGQLTEFLTLPSGGDTSYAGLAWHDNHLWVSYYSAHEACEQFTTAIYFAEVELSNTVAR